jgi:cytoskeletal protein RodZ
MLALDLPGRREASGVTLQQITESTKISRRFLEAIESEQFEQLPGGIFATSYIRQYAAAIGIDPVPALGLYRNKMGTETPDQDSVAERSRRVGFLGYCALSYLIARWYCILSSHIL